MQQIATRSTRCSGNQAVPDRNRQEGRPGMGTDGASGISSCSGTTRTEQRTNLREDVLPGNQPPTTRAGLPRQRMTWSTEINRHVMYCYHISTKLETTSINRPELRRLFLEAYSDYTNVTEQRLVD